MVGAKEAKTTAGEARVALDHTIRGGEMGDVDELEDDADDGGGSRGARGLATVKLNTKEIISNMNDAVTAKLGVGKLAVQIDVTISWVRKEQSVLRHKLQLIQELGMSAYGGSQVNKPRVMLADEGEYDDKDGIYATNDGERNAKPNGVRKDQKANGSYNRGTTAKFNGNIMFPCPC